MKVHTQEKSYQCDICLKKFGYRSSWKLHQNIHNGKTPYICKDCGQGFKQPSTLLSHRRAKKGRCKKTDVDDDNSQETTDTNNEDTNSVKKEGGNILDSITNLGDDTMTLLKAKVSGKKVHKQLFRGVSEFPCPECNKVFK